MHVDIVSTRYLTPPRRFRGPLHRPILNHLQNQLRPLLRRLLVGEAHQHA
jgi:hypothetical protein